MKLAICLYGHMRNYAVTLTALQKHVLSRYQPDVFIHTWDESEARTKTWHCSHVPIHPIDKHHIAAIHGLVHPVAMVVEKQNADLANDALSQHGISMQGQQFMLHSLKTSNQLRLQYELENGAKYDAVMKLRPDAHFFEPLNIPVPKEGEVFISGRQAGGKDVLGSYKACDVVNIAGPETMTRICAALDHYHEFYVGEKQCKHSPFVDYIQSLGVVIHLLPQKYGVGKTWALLKKNGTYA